MFEPEMGNWASILTLAFVVLALFFVLFTTGLGSALIGIAVVAVLLVALYYIGMRVHRRLLNGSGSKIDEVRE